MDDDFVLKSIVPSNDDEWQELRKGKITATNAIYAVEWFCKHKGIRELAKSLNANRVSKFGFATEKLLTNEEREEYLMLDKLQNTQKYEAFAFGNEHEQEIGEYGFNFLQSNYEGYEDAVLIPNGKRFFYIEDHNVGATPDFIVSKKNGEKVILECKTCAYKSYSADLVHKYTFQVNCQMLCTGIKEAFIVFGIKDFGRKNIIKYKVDKIYNDVFVQKHILLSCDACYKWLQDCKTNGINEQPTTKQDELLLQAKRAISIKKEFSKNENVIKW